MEISWCAAEDPKKDRQKKTKDNNRGNQKVCVVQKIPIRNQEVPTCQQHQPVVYLSHHHHPNALWKTFICPSNSSFFMRY